MALQALRQAAAKKSGNNGNFTPGLDPMVEFVSAEIVGDPNKDYFVVRHMNNCPEIGKNAGDLDKYRLSELKPREGVVVDPKKRGRPTLADHAAGKNRCTKAVPGAVYVIENAYRGRDGVLLARWTNQVAPAKDDPTGKITSVPGALIKLYGLRTDKNGAITGNAGALMPNAERAVRVHGAKANGGDEVMLSFEDMMKLDEVIYQNAGKPKAAALEDAVKAAATLVEAGNPGFVLRALTPADPTEAPMELVVIERRRVPLDSKGNPLTADSTEKQATSWRPQTADEVWADCQVEIKKVLGEMGLNDVSELPQEVMVELIPFSSFPAVGATKENLVAQVDASKKNNPGQKYHHDRDSQPYVGPVVDNAGKIRNQACWLESNIVIHHADKEPGRENEEDFYFRTYTKPRSRAPLMFANAELPTPNVSDAHVAAFTAAATKRFEDKKERDKRPEQAAPAGDNSVGHDDPVLEAEAANSPTP